MSPQERASNTELNREVGELKSKMDMILEAIRDLKQNYVTVSEYRSLEKSFDQRITKIETAPTKWLPIIVSALSLAVAYFS